MEQFSFSTRLVLAGLLLIASVILTALIDMRVHFNLFIIIIIMIAASFGAARIISNFQS